MSTKAEGLKEVLAWATARGLTPDDPRTVQAMCDELSITREMVEQCNRAIMYVKSPDTEDAGDALSALLDVAGR